MKEARDRLSVCGGGLVEYRLLDPDVFVPPRTHKRLATDRYKGPYEPRLELLDELDVIDVEDWGDSPEGSA